MKQLLTSPSYAFVSRWFVAHLAAFWIIALQLCFPAFAIEPIGVSENNSAIDLTSEIEVFERGDGVLKLSTAPDAEGIVRRIEVRSKRQQGSSFWAVFALANTSDTQIDRLIVAPHYRMVGSGIFWPDLDTQRIVNITPSEGFALDRQSETSADVFRITLDPGAVITLIAEQKTDKLPKLYLWEPSAYKDTSNSYTLYHGIVLGIAGLLAVFLTILCVLKGSAMFPATAALAWGVLAYICVDFGFWDKIIPTESASIPFWRAGTEIFLTTSLLIFAYAYLNLNRWHTQFTYIMTGWILALIILMGIALVEPNVAAGLARLSWVTIVFLCALLIPYLAFDRFDRAVMLIPTWALLLAWVFAAALAVSGRVENDIIQGALSGGLVLIVLLLAFTVMQYAFTGSELVQGSISDTERSALALVGTGDILWDWEVARDNITLGDNILSILNINRGFLNSAPSNWQQHLHPNDRDRFDATLSALLEHKRGKISQVFRLRADDGHYHWFHLKARPIINETGEVARCIGAIRDITAQKLSEERLLQDSVRDHLTGLENREIFEQRLNTVIDLAHQHKALRPSLFHIDIDNFQEINSKFDYSAGDTILLSVSRRLSRLLKSGDVLARLNSDQFALLLVSESEPKKIATFADAIRTEINSPIEFADTKISLTASIGLANWTREHTEAQLLMRDAELANTAAKRLGRDHATTFQPSMRGSKDDYVVLLEDIRKGLEQDQFVTRYQPIVSLKDQVIAGFEALVRWEHPRLGTLMPSDFIPIAERSGLINKLGMRVLSCAAKDFSEVNAKTGKTPFVSINISSRELLQTDFVADITNVLTETNLDPKLMRIEVTESMVMHNPEHSTQILNRIKSLGVGTSLDDFGTGYSSLAYLLRFPFDTIKIDKSFIQARMQHERLIVLRSIIGLAHNLNQSIIAEGVEFESDVTDLMQLGCEFAQGYLFGEPIKFSELIAQLQEEEE